ncbi:hypothetical protein NDU88_007727 [Pleurodeles waltl]|uniref:Uncharacterized protein n=1 Tax=Pleurodeles waltl TaxID=8319 RepID=A0AAV7NWU1_PLEWA|nr:hypothetical protein NDU88_007727 [Pleurodeles waltl]
MVACSTVRAARVRLAPPGGLCLDLRLNGRESNEGANEAMPLLSNHAQASSGVAQKIVLMAVMIRRVAGNFSSDLMLCSRSERFTARNEERLRCTSGV